MAQLAKLLRVVVGRAQPGEIGIGRGDGLEERGIAFRDQARDRHLQLGFAGVVGFRPLRSHSTSVPKMRVERVSSSPNMSMNAFAAFPRRS